MSAGKTTYGWLLDGLSPDTAYCVAVRFVVSEGPSGPFSEAGCARTERPHADLAGLPPQMAVWDGDAPVPNGTWQLWAARKWRVASGPVALLGQPGPGGVPLAVLGFIELAAQLCAPPPTQPDPRTPPPAKAELIGCINTKALNSVRNLLHTEPNSDWRTILACTSDWLGGSVDRWWFMGEPSIPLRWSFVWMSASGCLKLNVADSLPHGDVPIGYDEYFSGLVEAINWELLAGQVYRGQIPWATLEQVLRYIWNTPVPPELPETVRTAYNLVQAINLLLGSAEPAVRDRTADQLVLNRLIEVWRDQQCDNDELCPGSPRLSTEQVAQSAAWVYRYSSAAPPDHWSDAEWFVPGSGLSSQLAADVLAWQDHLTDPERARIFGPDPYYSGPPPAMLLAQKAAAPFLAHELTARFGHPDQPTRCWWGTDHETDLPVPFDQRALHCGQVERPSAPAGLTAAYTGPGRARAGWSAAPSARRVTVQLRNSKGGWNDVATVDVDDHDGDGPRGAAEFDVADGSTFCVRALAVNDAGTSEPSSQACGLALAAPALRVEVEPALGHQQLDLEWTQVANRADLAYRLYPAGESVAITTKPLTGTSYQHTGLAGNTRRCYELVAYQTTGTVHPETGRSPAVCARTNPPPVRHLTSAPNQYVGSVTLTWPTVTPAEWGTQLDGPPTYRIQEATDTAGNPTRTGPVLYQGTGTPVPETTGLSQTIIGGVTPGEHCYAITTVRRAPDDPNPIESTVTYTANSPTTHELTNLDDDGDDCADLVNDDKYPPPPYLDVQPNAGRQNLSILWDRPDGDVPGLTGYRLYHALRDDAVPVTLADLPADQTEYDTSDLEVGRHCYWIAAKYGTRVSALFGPQCADPDPRAFTPQNLRVLPASIGGFNIMWDLVPNVEYYRLYHSANGGDESYRRWRGGVTTNLSPGHHCFRVASELTRNGAFLMGPSSPTVCIDVVMPLGVRAVSSTSVELWQEADPTNVTVRNVTTGETRRMRSSASMYVYRWTGLVPSTRYCFEVQVGGVTSRRGCVTTSEALTGPDVKELVANGSQHALFWSDPGEAERDYEILVAGHEESGPLGDSQSWQGDLRRGRAELDSVRAGTCYAIQPIELLGSDRESGDTFERFRNGPPTTGSSAGRACISSVGSTSSTQPRPELTVTGAAGGLVDLTWTPPKGIDGSRVYQWALVGDVWHAFFRAELAPPVRAWSDVDPSGIGYHCYVVTTFRGGVESTIPSKPSRTACPEAVPTPAHLRVNLATPTVMALAWDEVVVPGARVTYRIDMVEPRVMPRFKTSIVEGAAVGPLESATRYCWQVYAVATTAGVETTSAPSETVCATTTGPTAPRNLRVEDVTRHTAQLRWDPVVAGDSAVSYRVSQTVPEGASRVNVNDAEYLATDLLGGTRYCWAVVAVSAGGESSPSSVCATTLESNGPPAPQHLRIESVTETSMTLRWDPVEDPEGAEVRYRIDQLEPDMLTGKLYGSKTFSERTGLQPGTFYCWQVVPRAQRSGHPVMGAPSVAACAETKGDGPMPMPMPPPLSGALSDDGSRAHVWADGAPTAPDGGDWSLYRTDCAGHAVGSKVDSSALLDFWADVEPDLARHCFGVTLVVGTAESALREVIIDRNGDPVPEPDPAPVLGAVVPDGGMNSFSILDLSWTWAGPVDEFVVFRVPRGGDGRPGSSRWELSRVGRHQDPANHAYATTAGQLGADEEYCFVVVALSQGQESAPSNVECGHTVPGTGPAPGGMRVEVHDGVVEVSADPSGDASRGALFDVWGYREVDGHPEYPEGYLGRSAGVDGDTGRFSFSHTPDWGDGVRWCYRASYFFGDWTPSNRTTPICVTGHG